MTDTAHIVSTEVFPHHNTANVNYAVNYTWNNPNNIAAGITLQDYEDDTFPNITKLKETILQSAVGDQLAIAFQIDKRKITSYDTWLVWLYTIKACTTRHTDMTMCQTCVRLHQ